MIALTINLNGDGALDGVEITGEARAIEVLVLDGGMDSGKPSVTFHFEVDGRHYIAQTSARLFCTAGRMIEARFGDLFDD